MKICFVVSSCVSYVKADYEILKKHFDVESVFCKTVKDIHHVVKAVRRSDLCYSWFAGKHSFIMVLSSKLFRKKSVVILGGGETANDSKIGYGGTTNKFNRIFIKWVLAHADFVLPVSKFTFTETKQYCNDERTKMIYNGVDAEKFRGNGTNRDLILTVASSDGLSNAYIKGLYVFSMLPSMFPYLTFAIIGLSENDKYSLSTRKTCNNLVLKEYIPQDELLKLYQKTLVYCQLSYRESFGMALAEAMSCGCVPVVTNRGALPEVVGDTGFIVPYNDVQATKEAIVNALNDNGEEARKRIIHNFSLDSREKELMHILDFLSRDKGTQMRIHKSVKVANVHPNDKILDLGCGNKILKAILPDGIEYTGIDMSEEVDIPHNLEDGIPPEIQNNKYDIIFLNEVIEHIENFRTLLLECKSILSENGRIIISTPSNNRILLFGDEDKDHIHCFRKTNMKHIAKKTGFVVKGVYGTYIRFPPLPYIGHPFRTNQTWYSDVLIYKLEKKHEN